MLRMLRRFMSGIAASPLRRVVALPLLALAPALPARGLEVDPEEPEVVAEAVFLCDPMPPGGRDVSVSLAGEPDDAGGLLLVPRVQVAFGLGPRAGMTADVALDPASGHGLDSPGVSLKVLLRDPGPHRLGVAASVDLLGASHSLTESEVAVGLGLLAPAGPVALRASASLATPAGALAPHLHGGLSAAFAPAPRLRLVAEVITELGEGRPALLAGPSLRLLLGEATSLTAGAQLALAGGTRPPAFVLQVTQSL